MSVVLTDPQNAPPRELTAADVASWLQKNPEFLAKHPELLDHLSLPKAHAGKGIADFQHYMVKRLRADRDEVLESAREIVETSRANMSNQARIHKCVLMVLETRTFEEFIHTITMDLTSVLGVDVVSILVEADRNIVPHISLAGVRAVPEGSIHEVMGDKNILLQSHVHGHEDVYGGGAGLVKSQALLRLNMFELSPVLIAFGSRNAEQFVQGQGTELITFFGHVLERCFYIWLGRGKE